MTVKKVIHTQYIDDETEQEYQFEPIEDTVKLTKTKDGFEMRYLTQDENPLSPDEYDVGENSLFLVHYHRDFHVENAVCPKEVLGYIYTGNEQEYDKEAAEQLEKDYYVFPVSAYIHSSVSLSLNDGFRGRVPQGHYEFDVSNVGAILVKKKEFGAGGVEFELNRDEAHRRAESLLQSWNEYLSNDVYCVVKEILNSNKEGIDSDIVSGYSGFEYAKECLKTEI